VLVIGYYRVDAEDRRLHRFAGTRCHLNAALPYMRDHRRASSVLSRQFLFIHYGAPSLHRCAQPSLENRWLMVGDFRKCSLDGMSILAGCRLSSIAALRR
jgi:hypothetical protein